MFRSSVPVCAPRMRLRPDFSSRLLAGWWLLLLVVTAYWWATARYVLQIECLRDSACQRAWSRHR